MAKLRLFFDRRSSSFSFVPKKDEPLFFFMIFLPNYCQIASFFLRSGTIWTNSARFFFDLEEFRLNLLAFTSILKKFD